mmetsp:Transcript_8198/g.32743  ORF Transcript_8198/g.32743 Transcript_8198/m.32743 type:complete len:264 (-) Transcript_8198:204-995(-)
MYCLMKSSAETIFALAFRAFSKTSEYGRSPWTTIAPLRPFVVRELVQLAPRRVTEVSQTFRLYPGTVPVKRNFKPANFLSHSSSLSAGVSVGVAAADAAGDVCVSKTSTSALPILASMTSTLSVLSSRLHSDCTWTRANVTNTPEIGTRVPSACALAMMAPDLFPAPTARVQTTPLGAPDSRASRSISSCIIASTKKLSRGSVLRNTHTVSKMARASAFVSLRGWSSPTAYIVALVRRTHSTCSSRNHVTSSPSKFVGVPFPQ